jgi:mRNA interferase MazF
MEIQSMTAPLDPQRGEIWLIDLEPTRGAEIRKTRPCVVVNAAGVGRLPLRIIVPITAWDDRYASYSWLVRLEPDEASGLSKPSAADAFQVRSVSLDRFEARLGELSAEITDQIAAAIALCVDAP